MTDVERNEWEQKLRALESLQQHEGWGLFLAVNTDSAAMELREAIAAKDTTTMSKKLGAHHAMAHMLAWVPRQIEIIRNGLKPQ